MTRPRRTSQRGADALRAGDIRAANDYVVSARAHVDRAMDASHGIGGDVWQHVPVAGGGVSDVRHLVEALDDATAIAEIGVDALPAGARRGRERGRGHQRGHGRS